MQPKGFALVVTLILLILLTVIAVGLLGLSSITLRSAGAGVAAAEARSNARLGLMLAIGDLQKGLGPDQRISARSSLVNGEIGEPNTLGVWESWRWNPESGIAPKYGDKRERFRRWLSSTRDLSKQAEIGTTALAPKDPAVLVKPTEMGHGLRAEKVP